jgi:hypothetical protein
MTPPPDDGGAAGLLTVIGGLVVTVLALAVVLAAAGVGVAAARARTAADAAALAAMGTSPLVSDGSDGLAEREAARVASANGARLINVDAAGWPLRVRVTVEVRPLRTLGGLLAPALRAHATAAARPSG